VEELRCVAPIDEPITDHVLELVDRLGEIRVLEQRRPIADVMIGQRPRETTGGIEPSGVEPPDGGHPSSIVER
jgi:hypothetical protein